MEVTNKDIHRNTLMPRYKTLVILARVLAEVRRLEVEGVGWNPETGAWDSELLERMCPMTVSALVSMPMTGDKTQRKFLQGYT
jgi:pentatricopeptide repeat-containing protein PET309